MKILETKYKDRDPKETVLKIKQFFSDYNLITKTICLEPTDINTWGCFVELLTEKNEKIFNSCGKGTTKEFAEASGYAELYERYCNRIGIFTNPFFSNEVGLTNYENFKYFFREDEKILSEKEIINNFHYKYWLDAAFSDEQDKKEYINIINPCGLIAFPYSSLSDNHIEYFNPALNIKIGHSSGMAAGNTLAEALVQGISELYERHVTELFYMEPKKEYFYIPKTILSEELQNIIAQIEAKNYKIFIFDLSYNYNFPVCVALLVDQVNATFRLDFGSAPDFQIAAERCLTELYQNTKTFTIKNSSNILTPYRNVPWDIHGSAAAAKASSHYSFVEELWLNKKLIDTYNHDIFLDYNKNYSNDQLLQHLLNIGEKNKIEFFYLDNSYNKDILYSVHIIANGLNLRRSDIAFYNSFSNYEKHNIFKIVKLYYNFICDVLVKNFYKDNKLLLQYIVLLNNLVNNFDIRYIGDLMGSNWFSYTINSCVDDIIVFKDFVDPDCLNSDAWFYLKNGTFYTNAMQWLSIYQYKTKGKYSNKEIIDIFKAFDIILTEDILDNNINLEYFITKIFIENIYENYSCLPHKRIIDSFIKK